MPPFRPLVSNPHLLIVLSNFWRHTLDTQHHPVESHLYRTDPDVQVLVETQQPDGEKRGELMLVHGMEGSAQSGYMLTMAQAGLEAGYTVHRFNIRTCGGTEHLCNTLYHSGLTTDLHAVLRQFCDEGRTPAHVVGYSLGGNMVLKLAGELGGEGRQIMASVCAVSVPIDLAASARRLGEPVNWYYERRFLRRMRKRVAATGRFSPDKIQRPRSLIEFDDAITAPSFGFRGAMHYYETQSSRQFLPLIRVPALIIQAKDDVFIPFEIFDHPAVRSNPLLRLCVTEYGSHQGFLSRSHPRFWADAAVIEWISEIGSRHEMAAR
ncbi:MAG TPA: alpha/beta fold hydrolase [Bryobacteraceae bacterium]|nr:alpha/beta fold hydrolase [Bryobacteraceae bacterium]